MLSCEEVSARARAESPFPTGEASISQCSSTDSIYPTYLLPAESSVEHSPMSHHPSHGNNNNKKHEHKESDGTTVQKTQKRPPIAHVRYSLGRHTARCAPHLVRADKHRLSRVLAALVITLVRI